MLTVRALLENGANPNIPFNFGGEPQYIVLHFEAYDGNRHGLIPALVKAGANVSAVTSRGLTPLHSAAICDFRLSCDDCGCDINTCAYPVIGVKEVYGGAAVACPSNPLDFDNSDLVTFFGAVHTLRYLVAKGGDPFGTIGQMYAPKNPANDTAWPSTGGCKETYRYLESLRRDRAP